MWLDGALALSLSLSLSPSLSPFLPPSFPLMTLFSPKCRDKTNL
jgi:hypothetical protein